MWPDRVSNPGPMTYESGALPIALRGPALLFVMAILDWLLFTWEMTVYLGPVVQSVVSLTESLVEDPLSLTTLTKSTAVVFSAEKL